MEKSLFGEICFDDLKSGVRESHNWGRSERVVPQRAFGDLQHRTKGRPPRGAAGLRNKGEVGEAFLGWGERVVRLTLEKDRH